MTTESIDTAVRMVGYLLEHNGITGPFAADRDGNDVNLDDPQACQFCLAGAIERVSLELGFCDGPWRDVLVTRAVMGKLGHLGETCSRVYIWEGGAYDPTTYTQRLAIARRLQR